MGVTTICAKPTNVLEETSKRGNDEINVDINTIRDKL